MSLAVVIKAVEGLVLAAESRVTVMGIINEEGGNNIFKTSYDTTNQLFSFNSANNIGVITYGAGIIGSTTIQSYIPEFESNLAVKDNKIDVATFSKKISQFFLKKWRELPEHIQTATYNKLDMNFVVAGYNQGEPFGKLFKIEIPGKPDPIEHCVGNTFGIWWGGQREIVDRLVLGYDVNLFNLIINNGLISVDEIQKVQAMLKPLQLPTQMQLMPLQECIDMATFLIRTTIEAQRLSDCERSCGGEIDIALIVRDKPLKWLKQKNLIVK